MSSFSEIIRIPTDDEKSKLYKDILQNAINSGGAFEKKEIFRGIEQKRIGILSEDEINAIMVLAAEMSRYVVYRNDYFDDLIPERKRLIELICKNNDLEEKSIILMINAITNDMRECRKYTLTRGEWRFHIKRIFEFIDGKDPYEIYRQLESEARALNERTKPELKVIIGGKYDE